MIKKLAIAIIGFAIVIGLAVSCSGGADTPGHKTTSDRSSVAEAPAEAVAEGPATSFTDGTFLVGSDIEAGTYKTDGDDLGLGCYWERASDDSGSMDAIITNNFGVGPDRVTVNSGEIFKVNGDCEWALVR